MKEVIIIDEGIRKEAEQLVNTENAHRATIANLSILARQANHKLWKLIKEAHPGVNLKSASLNVDTWEVTLEKEE